MYTLCATFDAASLQTEYWRLALSEDGSTLIGDNDIVPDFSGPNRCHVVMKKDIPVEVMAFYPSPKQLETNKARAWWQFAISAIRSQVRQRTI